VDSGIARPAAPGPRLRAADGWWISLRENYSERGATFVVGGVVLSVGMFPAFALGEAART
jgi:hypothetical protein